jgi:exosome complex component RRP4
MGQLIVKDKTIVVPGEGVADGMDFLPGKGTYREGDHIVASCVGLVNVNGRTIDIINFSGKYMPKAGDTIIGEITDISLFGWRVDTSSAYPAMLSMKDASSNYIEKGEDLSQYFNFGDFIVTKIIKVTTQKLVDISMKGPGLRKLMGGRIIKVNPNKVPRVIGKAGSMVSMIKDATGCRIIVGQNGVIWIDGDTHNEIIAVNTIRKIESEAHIQGLTERIKEYLEHAGLKPVAVRREESEYHEENNYQENPRHEYREEAPRKEYRGDRQ